MRKRQKERKYKGKERKDEQEQSDTESSIIELPVPALILCWPEDRCLNKERVVIVVEYRHLLEILLF